MTTGPEVRGVLIPVTKEVLDDAPTLHWPTPEEFAAAEARRADLKRRGLLADDGCEIAITDCPAVYYAGHEGDETFACEQPRGHDGAHGYAVEW